VLNDSLSPFIVDRTGSVSLALWIGFLVCLGSFFIALLLIQLDKKRCRLMGVGTLADVDEERFHCEDIKKLSVLYWILLSYMACLQISVFCFNFIASGFLQKRFGFSAVEAGIVMSITFLTTAFMAPLFGFIVDKTGKRPWFMISGAAAVTCFHLALMVISDSNKSGLVIFLFFVLGFGYSLNISSAFPSLTYVIDKNLRGTAFGLNLSLSNLNFVIFPVSIGLIKENTSYQHGYFWANFSLAMFGGLGIISGIFVYFIDKNMGGVLNSKHPVLAKEAYDDSNNNRKKSFEKMPNNK
jgi:MFS family permease